MASPKQNANVRLLALLSDPLGSADDEYRFLVDGKQVKYVTVEPGVLPMEDRTDAEVVIPSLPEFPPGDWNEGRVVAGAGDKDGDGGKDGDGDEPEAGGGGGGGGGGAAFTNVGRRKLPGIGNVWHPVSINHLELHRLSSVRHTLHRVTHPSFPSPVLAKFAQFPWEIPYFAAETTAYSWIHNQHIGPAFLGHIHEDGRVIGFLLEELKGVRTAEPRDLEACGVILERLHGLGIKHCDINKHNFLIRGDGSAVLIDFETAQKCGDMEQLEAEFGGLKRELEDTSGRGGAGFASDSSSE